MIDKAAGEAAFDDASVVVGGNLYWSGSLRFAVGAGAFAGGYDANGNMTVRVVDGKGQILSYDAENRLVQVQDSINTDNFVYDGDGNRVKTDVNNVVTYYVGSHFEWTGSTTTMVKYYAAGGSRVAMRVGSSTRYYLLSDHDLAAQDSGGTNVTVTALGTEYGEVRYKAFGDTRFTSGTTPTTMRYTGQRQESSIGLYFYGARWYDPALGRFVQADSIVPNPGDPVAFDRYAYTRNNPILYTDPSGHCSQDADYDYETCMEQLQQIQDQYGIIIDHNDPDNMALWTPDSLSALTQALDALQGIIGNQAFSDFMASGVTVSFATSYDTWEGDGRWDPEYDVALLNIDTFSGDNKSTLLIETLVHEIGGHGYLYSKDYGDFTTEFRDRTEWGYDFRSTKNPKTGPTRYSRNEFGNGDMSEDMAETFMVLSLYGPRGGDYGVTHGRVGWFNSIIDGNWMYKTGLTKAR